MRLSYEFTPAILNHILSWGSFISARDKRSWTEWDAKVYFLIKTEISKMRHERYIKLKKTKPQNARSAFSGYKHTQ